MVMGVDFVSDVIKFNAQTTGRDKICRLIQYSSKFLWYHLQNSRGKEELLQKLKDLENAVGTTRKLLRFGKSFDFLYGALKTIALPDMVWRLTLTLSKINQACYLLLDHVIWMGRVGLLNIDKQKWQNNAARFWVASIILNLVRDIYDIWRLIAQEIKVHEISARRNDESVDKDKAKHVDSNVELVKKCALANKPVFLDLLKNGTDIFLPLSTLGHVNISAGTQGMMGVISSIVGICTVWDPLLRLVPS